MLWSLHPRRAAGAVRAIFKIGLVVSLVLAPSCGDAGESSAATTPATTPATTKVLPPLSADSSSTGSTLPSTTGTTALGDVLEPSQDPAAAARDGVVAGVAALPLSLRVQSQFEIRAADGVWVISRPRPEAAAPGGGSLIGDTDGDYGRDFVAAAEYGEVLLLDGDDRSILRAWPLPGLPPQSLVLTEDAVYCARQGDGGLPDSMVCRIDRATGEFLVRIFPSMIDSAYTGLSERDLPAEGWFLDDPAGQVLFSDLASTEISIAVSGYDGYALIDPATLDIESVDLDVESPPICSTTGLDLDLVAQPDLPKPVMVTRSAIFDAAMECNYTALEALASAGERFFEASFGGAGVPDYWIDLEARGGTVLAAMARHLNQPHAVSASDEGTTFVWPSAMVRLASPGGEGLTDAHFSALLELYTLEELEEMFAVVGGYVGWRHGIDETGEWLFFVAGD